MAGKVAYQNLKLETGPTRILDEESYNFFQLFFRTVSLRNTTPTGFPLKSEATGEQSVYLEDTPVKV